MLPFKRDFNAARINRVVNDPSVFPEISVPGQGPMDLTALVADLRNIALLCDEGGIMALWREPGIYEIHTQFTERYRGVSAVRTVRERVSWLFLQSPAMELQTQVPAVNQAAHSLVKAISGRLEFERDDGVRRVRIVVDHGDVRPAGHRRGIGREQAPGADLRVREVAAPQAPEVRNAPRRHLGGARGNERENEQQSDDG